MAGGKEFGLPDYGDAIAPDPIRQGGHAEPNYTNPNTFESGMAPEARNPIESDWSGMVNDNGLGSSSKFGPGPVDGYRTDPVGGTYFPGNGSAPKDPGTERSATAG